MFPIDEAAVWARRDAVLFLRATRPNTTEHRIAEELSGDDVPALLDALVQVYGDLLSERHAIDETMDATDNKLAAVVWTREQSEHAAVMYGFGQVRHG
jgi:transposase